MTDVLFDLYEGTFSEHTATAPEKHKSELPWHFNATDRANVGCVTLSNCAISVVCILVCWVLYQGQVFNVLENSKYGIKMFWYQVGYIYKYKTSCPLQRQTWKNRRHSQQEGENKQHGILNKYCLFSAQCFRKGIVILSWQWYLLPSCFWCGWLNLVCFLYQWVLQALSFCCTACRAHTRPPELVTAAATAHSCAT